jgi:hypothetical protein
MCAQKTAEDKCWWREMVVGFIDGIQFLVTVCMTLD